MEGIPDLGHVLNARAAIIPHAHKSYAGSARREAFVHLNPKGVKYVIYIAAFHNREYSDQVYRLHQDARFPKTWNGITDTLSSSIEQEHSFKWVEPEIRSHFPGVQILAIALSARHRRSIDTLVTQIVRFWNKHKTNTVLLATTDLTHYGPRYDTKQLDFPQQMTKIKREQSMLQSMLDLQEHPDFFRIPCGPIAILVFLGVMKAMRFTGRIVDYYDSHGIRAQSSLDRYAIEPHPVSTFVSYVSMVYGAFHVSDLQMVLPIDVYLGVALLKSVIRFDTMNIEHTAFTIPLWSVLHKKRQGVFVGTEIRDRSGRWQTNCSYGRYEMGPSTTADKIIAVADQCPRDARDRWRNPYTPSSLDAMSYKIELLDPKVMWKKYPASSAKTVFQLDGRHGMLLTLANGLSSTFLPVVARDNNTWTIDTYMQHLSTKAGGKPTDWQLPNSIIHIYQSTSFKWVP